MWLRCHKITDFISDIGAVMFTDGEICQLSKLNDPSWGVDSVVNIYCRKVSKKLADPLPGVGGLRRDFLFAS